MVFHCFFLVDRRIIGTVGALVEGIRTVNRFDQPADKGRIFLNERGFQVVCRYNWNFGGLMKANEMVDDGLGALDAYKTLKNANFGGVTLSLAYFF